MTLVRNQVRACDWSLSFLRGSEFAEINSQLIQTKDRSACDAVTGILGSCTLLVMGSSLVMEQSVTKQLGDENFGLTQVLY